MILPYRELATESDAVGGNGDGDGVVAALGDGLTATDVAGEAPHATTSRPRATSNDVRTIAAA